jgi:hypothetical protein
MPEHIYDRKKERKLSALLFLDLEGEHRNNNFVITRAFSTNQAERRGKNHLVCLQQTYHMCTVKCMVSRNTTDIP